MINVNSLPQISFAKRRQTLFEKLDKIGQDCIVIIPANAETRRNSDVHYYFKQHSNFYYLTGFEEPDSIAIFRNIKGKKDFTLFVRPKDLSKEIWTGYRCGVEGATSKIGAQQAFPLEEFDTQCIHLLKGTERIYYEFFRTLNKNGSEYLDHKILRLLETYRHNLGRTGRGLLPIYDANELVGEMRLFKTSEEVERLRIAAQISAKAHCEAMARVKPGLYEYQVQALLEYVFKNEGLERVGYESIVAGGSNATILHYTENRKKIENGELLLIDAGAECQNYTADITRTFAINGKMTAPQRELYDITLKVQKECVAMARPGATITSIHAFAVDALTDAMVSLKFLSGDPKKLIETLAYKRYFPHGIGHFLGMDVHDVGLYYMDGEPRKIEPGMVFTVEPGFYVLFDDAQVPTKYRGIGIRIEDDVLITPQGNEVLTSAVPKEVSEIQALIGTKPWPEI